MTQLSIPEVAAIWLAAGGTYNAMVDAVSIASAESGRDPYSVSPSHDYGLWQINAIHFGTVGINATNWANTDINAKAAIAISGNGGNWAAWCSAWVDPGPNCGHGFIAHPQAGSPAADWIQEVQKEIVIANLSRVGLSAFGGSDPGTSEWSNLQNTLGPYARDQYTVLTNIGTALRRLRA